MGQIHLGIDLGTSGLKACALREDGSVVAETEAAYEVQHPAPGRAEIDPRAWITAVREALASIGDLRLTSVGIAGQMHGVVLVDENGDPCRPAILWPDRRAEPDLPRWRALAAGQRARLANPLTPGMAGPILAWLAQHEPSRVESAVVAVQPKDFVRSALGGPLVSERSDASATLLWDVPGDRWARDVVESVGIPDRLLPEIVPSHEVVGIADLSSGPAMVAGAGDTPAALVGGGGLGPGEVQVNLGTGAQILMGRDIARPVADPVTHLYADAGTAWYAMVAIQNAGLALGRLRQWLRMGWDELFAVAAAAPAGAGGVSMLPYLSGERGGVAAPTSRGAWLGLSDSTTTGDLARAGVEAMVFAVRAGIGLLGEKPAAVRVTGGGARNPLVPQMLADLLETCVEVRSERSASAVGAAMIAAAGVGTVLPQVGEPPVVFGPRPAVDLADSYRRWLSRSSAADL